jgi:paraquat-inducible protein B
MNDMKQPPTNIPEAKMIPKKRIRFSFVWLIPLVAAIVGVWIGVTTIRNQGPTITIIFHSAEGLDAGKTEIRYNGVEVGRVTSIMLSPDYQKVIATARMDPRTGEFLHPDTKFWVVTPQISGGNISGLSTLISGAYIGMEIGQSKKSERHFIALNSAPMETGGVHGRFFTLKTSELGSLSEGAPVYFRRLKAGQVVSYELDPNGDALNVKIFIQAPYDQFVTSETRFWQASGVDVSLSASGLKVQTQSLLSILIGGIAFETPSTDMALPPAAADTSFTLFPNREDAFRPSAQNPQYYTLIFNQSLHGLEIGAPVELDGITVGEVTDIRAQFDAKTYQFSAPVTIKVDPARFGVKLLHAVDPNSPAYVAAREKMIDALVAHGLRAQLQTGSLVTGARYIAFQFFHNEPPVTLNWSQTPVQLPTVPGQIESLTASLSNLGKGLQQIPFKELGDNLNKTIVSVQGTLTNTDRLLNNANRLIAPDSALDAQLSSMINQVGGAAQAISLLADYLERHPEALLRGKSGSAK